MSQTYTKEEAVAASLEYFGGDDLAAEVFVSKYALRDRELNLQECTPDQMHRRLAKAFAEVEKRYPNPLGEDEIFELFDHFKYIIPQGSPMFGIGNPYQVVSLSNCFVIDTVDSYGGICRADERIAQISKRRGGVGIDISPLRPKGMPTSNSALTTDGVIVFMERFSNTSREVAQSGRRGALMISISVHHPEVLSFIRAKRETSKITGANISVRVTDEFMRAVKRNRNYEQRWPVDSDNPEIKGNVKAREIWDELIKSNYISAEPGILFWDSIIKNSPADCYADLGFKTISTNPCGELPLCPLDSCRLLLLNLSSYVIDPFLDGAIFDQHLFAKHVKIAQRLMDDLVDMEIDAVGKIIAKIKKDGEDKEVKANELSLWEGILEKCQQGRRTGLGITGLGDCIAMMGIKYGDKQSLKIVEMIYGSLRDNAYASSISLAKERGAFPIYDAKREKDHPYLSRLPEDLQKKMRRHGRRNIGCLTTAPAGSVSTEAQTTSSGEPVFMAEYNRKRKLTEGEEPDHVDKMGDKWKYYKVKHHGLKKFEEITGKTFEESPYFGAQAEEVDFNMRVKMHAMATSYVDHAISSTVNLPADVDIKVVDNLYMSAWESGCKGLTIFRAGSRDGVLTGMDSTRECDDCDEASKKLVDLINEGKRPKNIIPASAPKRPEIVQCDIQRSKVGGGDWLFVIGLINGRPYEVFGGDSAEFSIPLKYKDGWILKNGKVDGVTQYNLTLGSLDDENEKLEFKGISKHFNNYEYGAFTRAISLSIRHGVPIRYICEQITKKGVEGDLFSFQRALSRVLKKYISEGETSQAPCPICGAQMVYVGGCPKCNRCGHSDCS